MRRLLFNTLVLVGVCFSTLAVSMPAYAKGDQIYTSWRNNQAVGGYDVVSFHTNSPIKGKPEITTVWNGAQWQFSTQANLESFLIAPDKYAPAYGGYCAWALAKNKLAKGSPKYWTVKDGRLYLNFNKKIKDRWLKDVDGFITKGDANWPAILD